MTLPSGTRLGPYEILAPLGAGGMGEVYRARDTRLQRVAAVKVLPKELSEDRDRLARFEQEARSASALNHPNIVTIYEFGSADGKSYVGMELVVGGTLRELLADGPLPVRKAVAIGSQIATGLAAAHEAGIIHRDLKPENVMVTRDGRVKLLDFGLAKLVTSPTTSGSQLPTAAESTQAGTILGTVGYMSPEQVRGLPLGHQTDIFSFGTMLYEMVSGKRPFLGATSADTMTAILKEDPRELPTAAAPLARILRRCLEKSPEERFQSARDLAFALETSATSASAPVEAAKQTTDQRHWRLAAGIVGTALAAFVAGLLVRPLLRFGTPPSFSRAVRLTSGPAREFGPAISPDGKWVAYLSDARGPVDVWVKFVSGGEAANLTEKLGLSIQSRDDIGGLGISPDGSLIAFDAGPRGAAPSDFRAWVIPAPLGGQARTLVPDGRSVRWSPDGRRIVYVRPGASRGDALVVADADGANAREVLNPRGGLHAHWPAWSRDGRFLYFIYGISGNEAPAEIARVPVAGGEAEIVVRTSRRAVYPLPLSGGLIYSADPDSADLALWWRPLSGDRAIRLTTAIGDYAEPGASADEREIVAAYLDPRQALVSIPVRFDAPVSTVPLTAGFLGDLDPTVSSQGDRLVWSSTRSGSRTLWIAGADGSNSRPLTSGIGSDERPAFSPDGKQVAFVSDRGGARGIWLVSAGGGAPRFLAPARVLDTLTWSPDASEILFAAPAGDMPGLYRLKVESGRVSRFPTPAGGHAPAWRPGRQEIAYLEITPETSTRLRFVGPAGERLHSELEEGPPFGNGMLGWSADGRRLGVAVNSGVRESAVFVVEPEGREPFRKLLAFDPSTLLRGISWFPGGDSLVVGRYDLSSHIALFTRDR